MIAVRLLLFFMPIAVAQAALDLSSAQPPRADKKPKDVTVHDDKRVDEYFWLREKENPAVIAYLKAENAYTDAVMASTKPLQEKLYKEMVGRIKETDLSVPARKGRYVYYTRTEQGKQYPIHCRKLAAVLGASAVPEEVLLDVNALAAGEKFMAVGHFEVSDDATRLAYTIDRNGHRDYEVRVKDLNTGAEIPQKIGYVASLEWGADNDTLFYTTEEKDSKRSYRVERWTLASGAHAVLFEETDELYDVDLHRSRDGRYLFCTSGSKTTTEVRALPSDRVNGELTLLVLREKDHEYYADHRDGLFYFVSNKGAKNYRVVTAPTATPDPAHWTEFIPHNPAVKIDGIDLFARHAVLQERENGLPHLRVIDLATHESHRIAFPEPVYSASPDANLEYDATVFRFRYQSLVTPSSVFSYDLATRTRELLKQTEVLGGYDPAKYRSERLFATATDGTQVPISIVYRTDLRKDAPQTLWLYAYGSYGYSLPDSFSSTRLSLLDRGFVYAIAHIRGGGEMGELWHDQGKMKEKMNTFTDFIACAEHLIKDGYTDSSRLIINGGSAGGLLMGAVCNLRPELFKAAIYDVPFVDVINTMLDESLPLTTSEYLEWGNPTVKEEYGWIRAYSPYDNIKAQAYPAILVNVSINDSQVPYWEGAKLVARLRETKTDSNPLLLRTNLDAGHGGASGRYDALKEMAFDYAFALAALSIEE
jgi:oligopeptidase B